MQQKVALTLFSHPAVFLLLPLPGSRIVKQILFNSRRSSAAVLQSLQACWETHSSCCSALTLEMGDDSAIMHLVGNQGWCCALCAGQEDAWCFLALHFVLLEPQCVRKHILKTGKQVETAKVRCIRSSTAVPHGEVHHVSNVQTHPAYDQMFLLQEKCPWFSAKGRGFLERASPHRAAPQEPEPVVSSSICPSPATAMAQL